eukprot:scaffold71583_cov54-Phaeocystis_antarctica.AAC.3
MSTVDSSDPSRTTLTTTHDSLLTTHLVLDVAEHAAYLVLDDAEHVAGIGQYLQHGQLLLVVAQLVLLLIHHDGVRKVAHLEARQVGEAAHRAVACRYYSLTTHYSLFTTHRAVAGLLGVLIALAPLPVEQGRGVGHLLGELQLPGCIHHEHAARLERLQPSCGLAADARALLALVLRRLACTLRGDN